MAGAQVEGSIQFAARTGRVSPLPSFDCHPLVRTMCLVIVHSGARLKNACLVGVRW
jgi:hypothetical protein